MALRSTTLVLLWLAAAGCSDDDAPAPADLGTPDQAQPPGAPADLSVPTAANDLSAASDDLAAAQGPSPFVVDDRFAASGFEGGGDVAGTITADQSCPLRAGDGRGHCHHLSWTPGTNSWGGVIWQYPANNWGGMPGFAMPAGYGQVRFRAWGRRAARRSRSWSASAPAAPTSSSSGSTSRSARSRRFTSSACAAPIATRW
ncbi:MAG: hypothetical protein ACXVCV_05485 [Polyangia bacterium]